MSIGILPADSAGDARMNKFQISSTKFQIIFKIQLPNDQKVFVYDIGALAIGIYL
jgi:hypothetical protein